MDKGRRVKLFLMLMIVMCLIYEQQSAPTYAGNLSQENSQLTAGEQENSEETKKPVNPEEPDNQEETDNPEEPDNPEKPDNPDEPDNPEEPDNPDEPEKKVEPYELQIPKVNGKGGFYTKKPEISICHVSEIGVTKYYVKHEDKKSEEKILKEKEETAVIASSAFSEGKNILHIWMENDEGEKIDEYETKQEILIDTKGPEIQMSVPQGFDAWYQEQVVLSVKGEDAQSGIETITCNADGKTVGSIEKKQGDFVITMACVMQRGCEVSIVAQDKAGNRSEYVKTVYIDNKCPEVTISGATDYMITSEPLIITGRIKEENGLQKMGMTVDWENVKGRKRRLESVSWQLQGEEETGICKLKKDGIYDIEINATDLSGHTVLKRMQVVIDKTNPNIRYVEGLKNQYVKQFCWDYLPSQMIWDFTTYRYDMKLDAHPYHTGKKIDTEGRHKLTVKAIDAAGNQTYSEAEFVIDHTKPEIYFKNVEEGKEYEEECKLQVGLTRTEDTIEQIQINGKNQKIDPGRATYQFTLHKCQDYEVMVRARDRAGNESEKKIYFKIVPKEVLAEKIVQPVKKYFKIDQVQKNTNGNQRMGDKNTSSINVLGISILMLGIVFISVGVGIFIKKHKNYLNREDAG